MQDDRLPGNVTLAVIVPTRNEAGNVAPLVAGLEQALHGISSEIIFVDDSDDDTPLEIANASRSVAVRIGLISRQPGARDGGLGGAVLAGLAATNASWAVVMDGDLQHPPALVPQLLAHAEKHNLDVVLASRFCGGRRTGGLSRLRNVVSHTPISASRALFPRRLSGVTDPLTGFFCVRRAKIDLAALRPDGFKILLEMLVRTPNLLCHVRRPGVSDHRAHRYRQDDHHPENTRQPCRLRLHLRRPDAARAGRHRAALPEAADDLPAHAARRKGSNLTFKERQKLRYQARLHSKEGRSIGMLLAQKGLPAAAMNAVVQIIIPPPKYDVTRLIPGTEMAQRAQLAGMMVIQRGGDGDEVLDPEAALDTLMENCDDAYGFPPYPVIQDFLHSRNGSDLRAAERRTTAAALAGVPSLLLKSSTMDWWQRLPTLVDEAAALVKLRREEAIPALEGMIPNSDGKPPVHATVYRDNPVGWCG